MHPFKSWVPMIGPCPVLVISIVALGFSTSAGANLVEVERAFLRDPRLLYFDLPPAKVKPHFASNEHEWRKDRGGREPVDLVVGFATNNVYDVALARQAKGMIIGDIAMEPLIVQAFLVRPFLLMAKTRAQFLGLLRGRWLTDIPDDLPVRELFYEVEERTPQIPEPKTASWILESVREIAGDAAVDVVKAYYKSVHLWARYDAGEKHVAKTLRKQLSPKLMNYEDSFFAAAIFYNFRNHYVPNPEYPGRVGSRSFLHSEKKYRRLRQMFVDENVGYVVGHVRDPKIYMRAAYFMAVNGWTKVAVTTSNIFDSHYSKFPTELRNHFFRSFTQKTCATFLSAGAEPPIYFRQTRGIKEHRFEHFKIRSLGETVNLRFRPEPKRIVDEIGADFFMSLLGAIFKAR